MSPATTWRRDGVSFGDVMNEILADLGDGFEISDRGELLSLGDRDMRPLLRAPLPIFDPENVESRVEDAKRKFLRQGSSGGERLDAVRGLADVLEFLRPNAKAVLRSADENDLFNLANNFGIRHHRADQKNRLRQGHLAELDVPPQPGDHPRLRPLDREGRSQVSSPRRPAPTRHRAGGERRWAAI